MAGVMERTRAEGGVSRAIEERTGMSTSDVFLWAAGASIIGSLTLRVMDREHDALFVGQWAPTFLLLGIYNKISRASRSESWSI